MVRCLGKEFVADVDQAYQEVTPLYMAAQEGKMAVVNFLVKELGADVNQLFQGFTTLSVAAGQGHLDLVRCLVLELHADVNQRNRDGATLLYVAAQKGRLALVRFLAKELGADINQATTNGSTPLMAAAVNKHTDVVKWLIKAGADTQASFEFNGTGHTAASVSRDIRAPADHTTYLAGVQNALLKPHVQRSGAPKVHRMQAGAILW
jgi:ankyrin repeat protein